MNKRFIIVIFIFCLLVILAMRVEHKAHENYVRTNTEYTQQLEENYRVAEEYITELENMAEYLSYVINQQHKELIELRGEKDK